MIITRQKPFQTILECIDTDKKVFLVGCALCATVCRTGGERQMKDAEEVLRNEGRTVTGWGVMEPACNLLEVRRLYRKKGDEIGAADVILSFACGGGTQTVVEIIKDKEVLPGNDTLFQGEIKELSLQKARFARKCSLCGDCMLALTGGICPVTRCPKGLVNGPCGGVKNGKCEADHEMDCVWMLIYERLRQFGRLKEMKKVRPPKDHGKNNPARDLVVK